MSWLDVTEPVKSAEEKAMDAALEKYEAHFGKPYVFQIGTSNTMEDTTAEIMRLIEEDREQELIPDEGDEVY